MVSGFGKSMDELKCAKLGCKLLGEHGHGQAPGAWPTGCKVKMRTPKPGDAHKAGDEAMIIGSVGPIMWEGQPTFGYFLSWDDMVGIAVFAAAEPGRLELIPR
jgi:hypothetical protein